MTALKLYIAGPMTGLPDFNYRAFFKAADDLAAVGIESIDPARSQGRQGCKSWLDYMRVSLLDIAECDGIAFLDGWGSSRGAALEVHIVRSLDLPVKSVKGWLKSGDDPMTGESVDVEAQLRRAHAMGCSDPSDPSRRTLYSIAADALAAATARAEAAEAGEAALRAVHARYFDLDGKPGRDDTTPEPEDVWRYDRDFRAALLATGGAK